MKKIETPIGAAFHPKGWPTDITKLSIDQILEIRADPMARPRMNQPRLTTEQVREILDDIAFMDREFLLEERPGGDLFLQLRYFEADVDYCPGDCIVMGCDGRYMHEPTITTVEHEGRTIDHRDWDKMIWRCFKCGHVWNCEPPKVEQKSRKWFISRYSTRTEVVETAYAACLRSMKHVVREHFLYKKERVMSPHMDIQARIEIASRRRWDVRK